MIYHHYKKGEEFIGYRPFTYSEDEKVYRLELNWISLDYWPYKKNRTKHNPFCLNIYRGNGRYSLHYFGAYSKWGSAKCT